MKRLTSRPLSPRRSAERGFVLLLVFAMAAGIAIMLYLEMPRIAFQHQRNKEAMLVDRGEQYKRALELYVKKYNKFPQTIDELEKPDNIRLLRRRYKDPMTGKDEWRLIHIDNSGQYIDSLIHKKEEEKKERHLLEADVQGIGASASSYSEQQSGATPFLQRTASDRILPGSSGGDPGAPPPPQETNPELSSRSGPAPPPQADPGQPTAIPGQMTGSNPGAFNPARPAAPGMTIGQDGPAAGAGQFPLAMPGGQPLPGQQQAQGQRPAAGGSGGGFGFGGGFGMGTGGAAPATPPTFSAPAPGGGTPNPQTPGAPLAGALIQRGGPQPGVIQPATPGGQAAAPPTANEALRMIQQQLTRPTPQAAVVRQGGAQQTGQQQGLAGGLAGVASTLDLEGILVYNERTNYKEWEFLADLKKIRGGVNAGPAGGQSGGGQRGGGQQGQPGMQGAPGFGGSGFGGSQGRPGQAPGMGGSGGAGRPANPPGGFGFGGAAPPKR